MNPYQITEPELLKMEVYNKKKLIAFQKSCIFHL